MEHSAAIQRAQYRVRAYARADRLIGIARAGHVGRFGQPEGFQLDQLILVGLKADHVVFAKIVGVAAAAHEPVIRHILFDEVGHYGRGLLKADYVGLLSSQFVQYQAFPELPAVFAIDRGIRTHIKRSYFHKSTSARVSACDCL